METAPFEWTFCGEFYRISLFPLTARVEVRAPDANGLHFGLNPGPPPARREA